MDLILRRQRDLDIFLAAMDKKILGKRHNISSESTTVISLSQDILFDIR